MKSPYFIAAKSPKFTMLKYVEIPSWNLHFFRVKSPMFIVQSHDITMNLAFFVGELLRLCCWSPCPTRSNRRLMLRSTPRTSLRSFRCQSRTISFADSCSSWGTGDWVKQKPFTLIWWWSFMVNGDSRWCPSVSEVRGSIDQGVWYSYGYGYSKIVIGLLPTSPNTPAPDTRAVI